MPIYVKIGATRVFNDVKLAVIAGADVIVVDGMQGGTAATQKVFIEHVGIPTLAAVRQAVEALEEMNMLGAVQLIISGGIRTGADVAKALALGADAVSIGQGDADGAGLQQRRPTSQDGQHHRRDGRLRAARHARRAIAITATRAAARSASRRRTRCSSSGCEPDGRRAPPDAII